MYNSTHLLYEVDLSQAENRIVAYIAPDRGMQSAFESGVDIHALTAAHTLGIPIGEISDEPGSSPIGPSHFSQRKVGKEENHSLNYGMGAGTFSAKYGFTLKESREIIEKYHDLYPGVRSWHGRIEEQLQSTRKLTNCFGRVRLFLGDWDQAMYFEGYNFNPQSTVADKINEHGLAFIYNSPDLGPVELKNQVHDSIMYQISLDVPLDEHAGMLATIIESLERPLSWEGVEFVIPAECKVGYTWGTMKEATVDTLVEVVGSLNDA